MKNSIYRQGDVSIQRISQIPKGLKKSKVNGGLVILAHGEVTGHHHSFVSLEVEKLEAENGDEYFKIKGRKIQTCLPILRLWKNQVMVNHPEFGIMEFAKHDVVIEGNDVVIEGNFGLLRHQEHNLQGIPEGLYKGTGAGNRVRQREYSPEAIRNNAD